MLGTLVFDKADVLIAAVTAIFVFVILFRFRSLPSTTSLQEVADTFNSKGGIIAILWVTSMIFFYSGVRITYWAVNMWIDNKLTVDNALIVACFNWISGSCFGGAFGAMIKTMTGEQPPKPQGAVGGNEETKK